MSFNSHFYTGKLQVIIIIYLGESVQKICGEVTDEVISLTSPEAVVTFVSDETDTAAGWHLQVSLCKYLTICVTFE